MGLRGRVAVRPHGEETVLPRLSRLGHADVRDAGMRFPLPLLPKLDHEPGFTRPGLGDVWRTADACHPAEVGGARQAAGRATRRLVVQRAADHFRVGGFQGSNESRAEVRVHLQRQRHARDAGVYPPLRLRVQDRSEVHVQKGLSAAGRCAREYAERDQNGARPGLLAGNRHAHHPRLQRQRR